MGDDGHVVRQVIVVVRLLDGDRQADRLWGVSYRHLGGDGSSDGLVKMADEQSDDDGQSERQGKMVYRWLDIDGRSDGLIMGLIGGLADRCVNDKLTGCQTDWSYDGWMGMTDRLAM